MAAIKKGAFNFNAKIWSNISQSAKDFISSLLVYDVTKRPTALQALQHKWIIEQSTLKVDAAQTTSALDNLIKFHSHVTMKAATLTFIGSQLISKSEREELARVFKKLDMNSDGKLSKEEIKDGYVNHFGRLISDSEVDRMFDAVDTDQSGYIDYTEFVVASANEKALLTNERLTAAFKMFDKDSSGMITPNEIKAVLTGGDNKVPNAIIESIISQVDQNGNGEISLQEFQELMRNVSL